MSGFRGNRILVGEDGVIIARMMEETLVDMSASVLGTAPPCGAQAGLKSWSRLSEQIFRFDKWSLCRG